MLRTYYSDRVLPSRHAGLLGVVLILCWGMYPFMVSTLFFHHVDAGLIINKLQGLPKPEYVTHRSIVIGLIMVTVLFAFTSLIQLVAITLIYRRIQKPVALWPAAILIIGAAANAIWYVKLGYFDFGGVLVGLTPMLPAVAFEIWCEKKSKDFVFSKKSSERRFSQ